MYLKESNVSYKKERWRGGGGGEEKEAKKLICTRRGQSEAHTHRKKTHSDGRGEGLVANKFYPEPLPYLLSSGSAAWLVVRERSADEPLEDEPYLGLSSRS